MEAPDMTPQEWLTNYLSIPFDDPQRKILVGYLVKRVWIMKAVLELLQSEEVEDFKAGRLRIVDSESSSVGGSSLGLTGIEKGYEIFFDALTALVDGVEVEEEGLQVLCLFIGWFIEVDRRYEFAMGSGVYALDGHAEIVKTIFRFYNREHCKDLDVLLEVYMETGRYVKSLGEYLFSELALLGEGCSDVYYGICPSVGARVAVKHVLSTMRVNERLRREIMLMETTFSDKVVGLCTFVEVDQTTYMILEQCDGDLKLLIRDEDDNPIKLPLDVAKTYIRKIVSCIVYLYIQCGIIHRDIKPGNILVVFEKDGTPSFKICDLGLSKIITQGNEEHSTNYIGTRKYMAPEIHERRGVQSNSDLFSLGVIMYEMVTGLSFTDLNIALPIIEEIEDEEVRQFLFKTLQRWENRASWEEFMHLDILVSDEGNPERYEELRKEGEELRKVLRIITLPVLSEETEITQMMAECFTELQTWQFQDSSRLKTEKVLSLIFAILSMHDQRESPYSSEEELFVSAVMEQCQKSATDIMAEIHQVNSDLTFALLGIFTRSTSDIYANIQDELSVLRAHFS